MMSTALSAALLGPRTDTWSATCPSGCCYFAGTFYYVTFMRCTLHYLCCVFFLDVLAIDESCVILYTPCAVISPVLPIKFSRETPKIGDELL